MLKDVLFITKEIFPKILIKKRIKMNQKKFMMFIEVFKKS